MVHIKPMLVGVGIDVKPMLVGLIGPYQANVGRYWH